MTNMMLAYRKAEIDKKYTYWFANLSGEIYREERRLMRDLMNDGMPYPGAYKTVYGYYPYMHEYSIIFYPCVK